MEQKNNQAAKVATSAPELVVPVAFQAHDPSLKGASLTLAINVGAKHPEIVQAVTELRIAFNVAGEKYYHVLHALRNAKLPKKEATALLLGLGFTKGRASELNKLSACKEEVWKQYSEKSIGFRAALALEDGKVPTGEQSDSGNEGDAPAGKKAKKKIASVPKDVQAGLVAAVQNWTRPLKGGARTEYGFTYEKDGVTYYFQIFTDSKE